MNTDNNLSEPAASRQDEKVESLSMEKMLLWERKLLDFSLRNNLLNLRVRGRVVPFVSVGIDRLEDALQSGRDFTVEAADAEGIPQGVVKARAADESGMMNSAAFDEATQKAIGERLAKHKLCSYVAAADLQLTLRALHRTARTTMEENGANALFLVLGMLRWYESERSDKPRYAPILLMPVDIVRRTGGAYVIRMRDEDEILNTTLVEMMRQQYEVDLSGLQPLPQDEHGADVKQVMQGVRDAIAHKRRWEVVEESVLGLFSFNKFVMWNDLHNGADRMLQNPIIQTLVDGRLRLDTTTAPTDAHAIDQQTSPDAFAVPLDVDSSQLEAVIESGEGRSFILYGPPGTGKSQTITNMIANALYHGRRVLFVAEKMAALSVVQKRLEKIGLGPFCLEMHSNKATKTHFLNQMEQALDIVHRSSPADYKAQAEQLFAQRRQLNGYMEALHRRQDNGLSLYDCIGRWLSIDGRELAVPADFLNLSHEAIEAKAQLLQSLDAVIRLVGTPTAHPLRHLFIPDTSIGLPARIRSRIEGTEGNSENLHAVVQSFVAACSDISIERLREIAGCKQEFDKATEALARVADIAVGAEDPTSLRLQYNEAEGKWALPRFFARRSLLGSLRKYNPKLQWPDLPQLLDLLANYRNCQSQLDKANAGAVPTERLDTAVHIVGRLDAVGFAAPSLMLAELPDAVAGWADSIDRMHDWTLWCAKTVELRDQGLAFAIDDLTRHDLSGSAVAQALLKGTYRRLAERTIDSDPQLQQFSGLVFEQTIERYRTLAAEFQNLTKQELYARLAARIPNLTIEAAASSEVGILKRNIKSKGRATTIRQLVDQIPTLLPRLCPCMLMSPLSVAQYIDLDREKFDIVVFDEASQMPTSEAVGAIARGKALVCVGDPKQMPPTSFFTTNITDEEYADIDDMESILDDCITLSMPARYLTWHYRSKHESLIAFSNTQYYESKLYTFPSVDDRLSKVTLVPIDGVYDMGHTRCNRAEAEAIVHETLRRLADPELSERSIGIVAFSKVQQDLIEDILEKELAQHPDLEAKAYDGEEPIFVKNLENVQGDERDIILFSVGYGPDKDGKVSMNFGPLNNVGGERRLNVAVSRARYEMVVFSTLQPEQIDLQRTNAKGVEGLKRFLEFARSGRNATQANPMSDATADDMALVDSIAAEIERMGYKVDRKVGRSNFKIDIAVVNPDDEGTYVLGILCDGKNYFDTKTERDREIVQPSVLGMLGWNMMKVWSVDWFLNREAVVRRIKEKLKA